MRLTFTLFSLLLLISNLQAQKLTGIWRGYFSSSSGIFRDDAEEEMYKYEVQIDQQSNNSTKGVTYSYKSTVFFGKSTMQGIYTESTKNLILKEIKLVELKIARNSEPCLMTCYLDYVKIGKLEVLQGTFISSNAKNKKDCGTGKVYLERVLKSAGPTQNLTPGYNASTASAIKCAEECQKVFFPASSSQVNNCKVASVRIGLVLSQTSPFTDAAKTFLASPSLMDLAIPSAEIPASYCLTAPSGNFIFIIGLT